MIQWGYGLISMVVGGKNDNSEQWEIRLELLRSLSQAKRHYVAFVLGMLILNDYKCTSVNTDQ